MQQEKKQRPTHTEQISEVLDELERDDAIEELLDDTEKMLADIDEVLQAQDKAQFKAKLKGWAKNQRRLSPTMDEQQQAEYLATMVALVQDCGC